MNKVLKVIGVLVLTLGSLMTIGCATRIGPGHVGIKVSMSGSNRGVSDYVTTTGWVFYNPFSSTIVEYPTFVQTYVWTKGNSEGDESFTFMTSNDAAVNVDVNLSYQIDAEKVPHFYVKFRNDDITKFTFGYLHNVTRDCFTKQGGQYSVEDLMGNSAPFVSSVQACVQAGVKDIGVEIQNFGIVGAPRPPQQITDSINAKLQAQQIALQKTTEIQQAEAEAKKQVAEAEGNAKSHIAQANGDAAYRIKLAQAEAEANRALSTSLTPQLLEWRRLQIQADAVGKWDGQRPQVEGSGSGLLLQISPREDKK
jgi:regulator of protease activity HflC (stomatin/prohibitin superfamily)